MEAYEERPLMPCVPLYYGSVSDTWVDTGQSEMENPPIGISQQQLVSSRYPGNKLPQYAAALSAALGALATGSLLGWSAPAGPKIMDGREYGFDVTPDNNAWVGSLSTLGAAFVCIPVGIVMDKFGRKRTMLLLAPVFVLGWLLVIFAASYPMLLVGRFIAGVAGGAFCVTAPTYNMEIAQDSVRGTLGSFFQLMMTIGILFSYVVGYFTTVFVMSIICGLIPIVFAGIFFFMPETPYYLVLKGNIVDARKSLIRLRGVEYDCDSELKQIENKVNDSRANPQSLITSFSKLTAIKAVVICFSLMFFQQFSGINAVLFNTNDIFERAGADIDSGIASIIIGVMQVVATLLSTFVVDKLGRRVLLLLSAIVMAVCGVALGVFFYYNSLIPKDDDLIARISWLPLVSLCIFIIAFSIGFGPIPWMVAGELCTPEIKATVSSTAGTFNWLLAFVITTTFVDMQKGMGEGGAFWFFAGLTFAGAVFVFFAVPETKGKSLDDIQKILKGNNSEKN